MKIKRKRNFTYGLRKKINLKLLSDSEPCEAGQREMWIAKTGHVDRKMMSEINKIEMRFHDAGFA